MDKEKACKICSKRFSSGKALGGHMRSHRLSKLSPLHSNPNPMSSGQMPIQIQTINRDHPWKHEDDEEEGTSSSDPALSTEEVEVAWCLVMMSRDGGRRKDQNDLLRDSGGEELAELAESVIWKFRCKRCKKVFASYQALGGHNASHRRRVENSGSRSSSSSSNNNNNNDDDDDDGEDHPKVFECSLCPRVFVSGQALGGHKKVHCSIINNNKNVIINLGNNSHPHRLANTSIDLNRPPCYDYDDQLSD